MSFKDFIKPKKSSFLIFLVLFILYFISFIFIPVRILYFFRQTIFYPITYYSNNYGYVCKLDVCMQTPLTMIIEIILAFIYCYLIAIILVWIYAKVKKK